MLSPAGAAPRRLPSAADGSSRDCRAPSLTGRQRPFSQLKKQSQGLGVFLLLK